jgi:GAF domain-containing protein
VSGDAGGALGDIVQALADAGPAFEPPGLEELLRSITGSVRELFGAAACSIAVLDPDEEELTFVAASGTGAEQVMGHRMPAGAGIVGWVLASGQSISIADVRQDPRFAQDVAAATGFVPTSIHALPLIAEDDPIGVMEILDAERLEGPEAEELLATFVAQAATALETSLVFHDLGAVLLDLLAQQTGPAGQEVRPALRPRQRDLAELAWVFYELRRLGPETRASAQKILVAFLDHAERSNPVA